MGTIKTILLTGATGYLGSRLLDKLFREDYAVCIIKRKSSSLKQIEALKGNYKLYDNDEESIERLFFENKIDLVIHMATAYGRKGESILEIKSANLDFPLLILKNAVANNVKYFINTGTSLPYLANLYSLFKNQFSECLEFFSAQITSVNVLLEHFYGPGDDDTKFITAMIRKMKSNVADIPLTAGIQIRDFIFVDDVLDAYFAIIANLNRFSGYTNLPLGSGEGVTIRKIVENIKRQSKSTSDLQFGAVAMRENELMKSDADISLLKELGWSPKYTLEKGLKITIDSIKI
ncbi:NAD(P)-dependent oxidoreductase [Pedobacter heparinus]|uniref:NAD-dependent epimerase/dehydratase family protein n=1 Tax=Pedobacter heparinus TaxID=984 RepID=UPI00292EB769|nr:NAD(P)-dependent oxidoreductase [Pedobacter heparinus]